MEKQMSISKVQFELDTSNISAGATSVPGTLTLVGQGTDASFNGFITPTASNYNTPPADPISGNLDSSKEGTIVFTSLQVNKPYYVKVRTYPLAGQSGTAGGYRYFRFTVPKITDDMLAQKNTAGEKKEEEGGTTSVALNKEILISQSLLQISTDANKPNTLSSAVKDTGIDVSGSLPAYYAFGTTLFFDSKNLTSKQGGGIGFFVNGASETGYFISIKTSESASNFGDEFKILKVKGGVIQQLPDSQSLTTNNNVGAAVGILPGTSYKIDVIVKTTLSSTEIKAYINGFLVTAKDTSSMLPRTSKVSLFANLGTIYFDYVYAMPIKQSEYEIGGRDSIYNNQMSLVTTALAYGDIFVSDLQDVNSSTTTKYVEEFGPVAREIRYVKRRYERTPSFPKFTFQNLNKGVNVLASRMSSFDAELYLINNSGVSNSISSDAGTQISVVGNNLVKSDEIVYMDEDNDKFGAQEPITFSSSWIQKISDAAALSSFIKSQWTKDQRVVQLETFGNPMLEVSDIITVKYPYHNLAGTEKFIVTDINHSWQDGLVTQITARSIFS
jgi:hypothetical protein